MTPLLLHAALALVASETQHRHDGGGWPYTPPSFPESCLGEFSFCNSSRSCVLVSWAPATRAPADNSTLLCMLVLASAVPCTANCAAGNTSLPVLMISVALSCMHLGAAHT